MNVTEEIKTKQNLYSHHNFKRERNTKARIQFNMQLEKRRMQNLINCLYENGIKPSLNNLEDSSALILVEDESELLAFVTLYETNKDFLTLGNYQCVNDGQVANQLFEKRKSQNRIF